MGIIWPPPLDHLINFIAYLSVKGLAPSTARSYVSAISFKCKLIANSDPSKHFLVIKVLEGMKRLKNQADTRLPITPFLLSKVVTTLPVICFNMYESTLFIAAFTLAFFGFLRVGEFTVTPYKLPSLVIAISDIAIDRESTRLLLTIRFSKTDQLGKGVTLMIPKVGGPLCPVHNLRAFLDIRPKRGVLYFVIMEEILLLVINSLLFSTRHLNFLAWSRHVINLIVFE